MRTTSLILILFLWLSIFPAYAQISGHHNLLLDPSAKPAFGFRTGHLGETLNYHRTNTIARPYFGADGFLSRANSLFLFTVSTYIAIHSGDCSSLPSGHCWQDFEWQDAQEALNYANASSHWDVFADPCDIPGDETWMYVVNPATATSQAFHEGLGVDRPAWHNMRRISPCQDTVHHSYSPSDPFLDHPNSHRLFLVLDQSNAIDFVRWRIQSIGNRDNGVRDWAKSESAWQVLAEVSPSLIGTVDILNMVCTDAGLAGFHWEGGQQVLDVVEKSCLFNFLVNNGGNQVGRLNFTIDFGQAYPYTSVEIMNQSGFMQSLTRSGNKWILSFTPGNVSLLNGHIVQSIDAGSLYTMRHDNVSGVSFCGNGYSKAFRLYRWPNFILSPTLVSGSPSLISKSAAGNPPGSTFLPTTYDRHLARFTFGASGNYALSGSKWDPHKSGLPWVCTQDSFFNMGVVVEPYN